MSDTGELRALVRAFRGALVELESAGRQCAPAGPSPGSPGPDVPERPDINAPAKTLGQVREELGDCQRCPLSERRQHIVFGRGSEFAPLLFVGEAPGAEEDKTGQPFVGKAGQLLDKMIAAMGWARDAVYIANVLKCRPPDNRDPKVEEVAACESFLAQQIAAISPAAIVTLGKPAAHLLLRTSASMGSLRGVWQTYADIPLMPTYHPAYLLRDPSKKRETWADLQQVMQLLHDRDITPD